MSDFDPIDDQVPQERPLNMESHKRPRPLGAPPATTSAMRKASWSYLKAEDEAELVNLYKMPSLVASLSEDADAQAYFEARAGEVEAFYKATRAEIKKFKVALGDKKIDQSIYSEAVLGLEDSISNTERELGVLKRQKRTLIQDAEEMAVPKSKIMQSWVNLLLDKVRLAGTPEKKEKFDQVGFRKRCLDYYGAERIMKEDKGDVKYQYCVVLGEWVKERQPVAPEYQLPSKSEKPAQSEKPGPKSKIIAAHIVPKVLNGSELNQLFEVGETMLGEARNSLPLYHSIEKALDDGFIVIVPEKMDGVRVETYKVLLVDERMTNLAFRGEGPAVERWGSLDGKVLRFLTPKEVEDAQATLPETVQIRLKNEGRTPEMVAANRPAQRYLYFRCVATYLLAKRRSAEVPHLARWIKQYEANSGYMWLTPGRYARQSMMTELAMATGDMYLPEARMMFSPEIPSINSPSESKEWESPAMSAIGIKQKLLEHQEDIRTTAAENDDEEDDEEDDD